MAQPLKNILSKMMNEILNQYKVSFSNPAGFGKKLIDSVNVVMNQFIGDHYTFSDANDLLNIIDGIISSNSSEFDEVYTQSEQIALINSTVTKIYADMDAYLDDNNIAPDFTLPTAHFKIIVEAWRDYLT